MTEHAADQHADDHAHADPDGPIRETAPMQEFGTREIGLGIVILVIGLVVTFGLPLVLL